jgi:tetratricopeptide (TPR) repeat protein
MRGGHCADEDLLSILDGDDLLTDIEAAQAHMNVCSQCRQRYDSLRQIDDILAEEAIHFFAQPAAETGPLPGTIEALRDRATRNAEEDEEAERTFEALTSLSSDNWMSYLRARPGAITAGLVRRLTREARDRFDRRPTEVLGLLDMAEELSREFQDPFTVTELRGSIAKERGEALRMLGRYPEALDALDVAEALIATLPTPSYDLAFVECVRAGVLFSMSRYDEALPLIRGAGKVLRQHGDIKGAQEARFVEATILCERGDIVGAHRMFSRLAIYFAEADDREMVARASANLAECEVRLDHRDLAYEYAADAMRAYEELGYETEKIRVRWILGHALMRQGHTEEALVELRDAAEAFDAMEMLAESGEVGLDIAEIHLTRKEWSEAETLARDLALRFTAARVPLHQARAFACLRDAVEGRTATAELVEYLRGYLSRGASGEDPVPFDPPIC